MSLANPIATSNGHVATEVPPVKIVAAEDDRFVIEDEPVMATPRAMGYYARPLARDLAEALGAARKVQRTCIEIQDREGRSPGVASEEESWGDIAHDVAEQCERLLALVVLQVHGVLDDEKRARENWEPMGVRYRDGTAGTVWVEPVLTLDGGVDFRPSMARVSVIERDAVVELDG